MFCKLFCGSVVRKNLVSCVARVASLRPISVQRTTDCSSSSDTKLLDDDIIKLLEKLALVNFENREYVKVVEDAIKFADGINSINTDSTEPLVSILEDRNLRLREDIVTETNCCKEILRNAVVTEENYFVAPPGNVPLNQDSNMVSHFKYGPLGSILSQNIFNEWMLSTVTCRDGNVFPFHSADHNANLIAGVAEHYSIAKKICGNQLPFSIIHSRVPVKQKVNPEESEESKYFRPENVLQLRCVTFTAPDEGRFYFHYWLRQRKFWWRRFSANPARFSVTNIDIDTENLEFANIEASFPWGVESIEEIRSFSDAIFNSLSEEDQTLWKLKPGKKNVFPCIIESVTNVEIASMCFLCDAFVEDVRLDTELPHQVIKLHRKLAPYKIAIVADTQKAQKNEDLIYLAEFLTLNLKKLGISTLYLLKGVSKPVEEWFQYYDLLSVPYVVVLQESTLSDGLFGLRNRETTLQERLHIDQLNEYVEKLLKNY